MWKNEKLKKNINKISFWIVILIFTIASLIFSYFMSSLQWYAVYLTKSYNPEVVGVLTSGLATYLFVIFLIFISISPFLYSIFYMGEIYPEESVTIAFGEWFFMTLGTFTLSSLILFLPLSQDFSHKVDPSKVPASFSIIFGVIIARFYFQIISYLFKVSFLIPDIVGAIFGGILGYFFITKSFIFFEVLNFTLFMAIGYKTGNYLAEQLEKKLERLRRKEMESRKIEQERKREEQLRQRKLREFERKIQKWKEEGYDVEELERELMKRKIKKEGEKNNGE